MQNNLKLQTTTNKSPSFQNINARASASRLKSAVCTVFLSPTNKPSRRKSSLKIRHLLQAKWKLIKQLGTTQH